VKTVRDVLICVLAACALATLGSCKSVLGPTPPPNTPGFVNCSEAAIHAEALNLLPAVENALAGGSWEADLLALAASAGGPLALAEVDCAIAWVEDKAATMATATADSLEATKVAHAQAWFAKHPVTFQVAP
jgi:hypothetical protein